MVVGLGTDVVDIERLRRVLDRWHGRFERRVFSEEERRLGGQSADPATFFAGRFAAKEAAVKALAPSREETVFLWDVEVKRLSGHVPSLLFHKGALELAEKRGVNRRHVSISHDGGVAMATVILES